MDTFWKLQAPKFGIGSMSSIETADTGDTADFPTPKPSCNQASLACHWCPQAPANAHQATTHQATASGEPPKIWASPLPIAGDVACLRSQYARPDMFNTPDKSPGERLIQIYRLLNAEEI